MFRIYQLGIAGAAAFAVLAPIFGVLWMGKVLRGFRAGVGLVFCLYLSVVFSLVGMPSLAYWQYLGFEGNWNLIPFLGMGADWMNEVLNVLMFVPLGILLPVFWQEFRSARAAAAAGFCLSLFIELMQVFTYRATDINDLITNTAGALIGYIIARGLIRRYPFRQCSLHSLWSFFGITCLVMFFVQPYIVSRMELWLLY